MDPKQFTNLGKITTPYGGQTKVEPVHPGVDIANKKRTPIPAFAGGVVQKTINGRPDGEQSFGISIILKDKKGALHRYSHLDKIGVRPGQQVSDGQQIATMGSSGAAYSPNGGDPSNLDLRIVDHYGRFLNPVQYIDSL